MPPGPKVSAKTLLTLLEDGSQAPKGCNHHGTWGGHGDVCRGKSGKFLAKFMLKKKGYILNCPKNMKIHRKNGHNSGYNPNRRHTNKRTSWLPSTVILCLVDDSSQEGQNDPMMSKNSGTIIIYSFIHCNYWWVSRSDSCICQQKHLHVYSV